ncbi:MAG: tripartite tricarboxylate transporter substrate-binding protein, partial [Burkholderiaceae bacterium]
VKNLNEFGTWLKANPNLANFGVPAPGSVPQFASLIVGKSLGVPNPVVVPYKGGAPLVQDLLGGQVPAGVSSLTEYIEYHRAGRINVLAISGTTRSKAAPDVPTFQELGLKGIDKNPWLAFVGPKGMPRPFIDRFSRAVATVLRMPDVIERLSKLGNEVAYATPEQTAEWISSATLHWAPVIRDSGYQLQ